MENTHLKYAKKAKNLGLLYKVKQYLNKKALFML